MCHFKNKCGKRLGAGHARPSLSMHARLVFYLYIYIACSIECWTHAVFYYCLCANRSKQTMTHLCFATNEKHSKIYKNCKVTTNQLNILARCQQKNKKKQRSIHTLGSFFSLFNLAVRHSLSFFVYHARIFFFLFFFKLTHCESNSLFSILGNNNIYTLLIQ